MKHAFYIIGTTITILILSLLSSCRKEPGEIAVESVKLSETMVNLHIGETTTLTATVTPENATNKSLTWLSSNTSVAFVNNGVIIALKEGSSMIMATAENVTAMCAVNVLDNPVTDINLNQASVSLKVNESITLTATVSPANATDKTVIWSTSDASVATVSNGVIIAVSIGSATITAIAGDKKATCDVNVIATPVEKVTLDKTDVTLKANENVTLTATVSPDDATDKTIIWSTSDANVATVSNGVVIAVKVGTAIITAQAGDKKATCSVTVEAIPVTSVTFDKTSASLKVGESITITAIVKPDEATDKTVSWTSSNESVATIKDGIVTALKAGSSTVTAQAGDKKAICSITVEAIPVTDIILDKTSVTMNEGDELTLVAAVKPDDATNKNVTWNSSNPSVASVVNGKVKAQKTGSTTISVTTEDGNKTANCDITVVEPPKATSLSLSDNFINGRIYRDHSKGYWVSVTASPSNAVTDYEWNSSDTRVANVLGSGSSVVILTDDYGKTTISVTDKRTGLSASMKVQTMVENFSWNESTSDTMYGYPMITIYVNEGHKLKCSYTPSYATKIFSDLDQLVFYEPYVVDKPSCISISEDGVVTGLKAGVVGIKPTGLILRASGTERLYIKVIDR